MISRLVLLSNLLLASVVLADSSSQLEALLARNDDSDPQSLFQFPMKSYEWTLDAPSGYILGYSDRWAGAFWIGQIGTVNTITGTFVVPSATGSVGDAFSASVNIDGGSPNLCNDVSLSIGVLGQVSPTGVSYVGWYDWYPDHPAQNFGVNIQAGHHIKLTISAETPYSATLTIQNLDTHQAQGVQLISRVRVCGEIASWIIDRPVVSGRMAPLLDFGMLTFYDASATGPHNIAYTPRGAIIVNLWQGRWRTFVSVSSFDGSLTIVYLP